ncbi:MAG: hypothetical protein Q4C58_16000 [Eubacteriales bacterium]|nr:hypothetical protein [Eubacteriales bacterium]
MKCELIHIVPFDMGISFSIYEDTKRQSKEQFMDLLKGECRRESFTVLDGKNDIVGTVIINENIMCRLFSYGIGVFILKNLRNVHTEELEKAFQNEYACKIYYEKKAEQKEILDLSAAEVQPIKSLMRIIWNIGKNKTRGFSASGDYKHEGLSYVLTVYHIVDEEIDDEENRQIDLLMNPGIMREILTRDKWDSIKRRIEKYRCVGYNSIPYNDEASVVSSWSAVAVIEKSQTKAIEKIIDYEVSLQAGWFLFDALTDNLEKTHMSNLELQRNKSIITNVFLDISNIMSANMGTNEKQVMENIYETSGIDEMNKKCKLLLENRIAIEEVKMSNRQSIYGIITEILLVSFTLIQIYDPIKNFFTGRLTGDDLIVSGIMLLALIVSSIFIIRKGK